MAEDHNVDPRLVALLQYFRELYVEMREVFKKIFPEEFGDDILNKMHDHHHRHNDSKRVMMFRTRSLSLDSPRRTLAAKGEAEQPVKMEKFKVKTFDVKGGTGQGGTTR